MPEIMYMLWKNVYIIHMIYSSLCIYLVLFDLYNFILVDGF